MSSQHSALNQYLCLHSGAVIASEEGSDGSLIEDVAMADKICALLQVSKEDFTRTFQKLG